MRYGDDTKVELGETQKGNMRVYPKVSGLSHNEIKKQQ
jgi:hypothetical protein